jgi:ADP-ribosylglycohydrolase
MTIYSISRFSPKHDERFEEYNMNAGGNGCAMRNLVIGLCLHRESELDQLIDVSVITSKLTHHNAFGYLAGFTTAYFTSLAIRKVNIIEWPYRLLELLKSDRMVEFIKKTVSQETRDYLDYIMYWEKHIDNRFDKDRSLLKIKSFTNPMFRIKYYYDQFHAGSGAGMIGNSGYLATIMAYDAFLDSGGVWEKLILYGMLHIGDSDTVGAIAAGLYGAFYGFGDVPANMYAKLEMKDDIEQLARDIENKFY